MAPRAVVGALLSLAASGTWLVHSQASAAEEAALRLTRSIPLSGVKGRIDHLALDPGSRRLFVAALGNDTVEVIDTADGRLVRSLKGFHEPQGIAIVQEAGLIAVANGGTGTLQLIAGDTLETRFTTEIGGDADNVRYDAAAHRVYVAAEGGLFAVDPSTGRVVGRVAFPGHPESFQLERNGPRVFANLPGSSQVVVGDRRSGKVLARWPTSSCGANYPMSLDEEHRVVFVGCRRPASVAMFDARTGRLGGTVPAVGDTDDMFLDSARRRLYVIGGEGFIDVMDAAAASPTRLERVATASGARTGLWVEQARRLYLAVPDRTGRPAEVRVFEATR
jgi:DNA-binding beta-propeller fold protein YncE